MISKSLILLWLCGTLFLSTVGVGFYAIQQTVRIASLTAELTNSATELVSTNSCKVTEHLITKSLTTLYRVAAATARRPHCSYQLTSIHYKVARFYQ